MSAPEDISRVQISINKIDWATIKLNDSCYIARMGSQGK